MIRTVIQQKQSFTITIPKKWAKENNITNKSEIKIEEDKDTNNLILSKPNSNNIPKLEIIKDVDKFDFKTIRVILHQSYRNGYDKITFLNVKKEYKNKLEELTKQMIGFTFSKKENNVTFETLTQDQMNDDKINALIRKLFTIINETYSAEKENLNNLKDNADTYTNYLRRIIIKFNIKGKISYSYFNLITKISLIQHAIYYFRKEEDQNKENEKILTESKRIFEILEEGLFKENISKINDIYEEKKKIDKLIDAYSKKKNNKNPTFLYEQIRTIELATAPIQAIILNKQ